MLARQLLHACCHTKRHDSQTIRALLRRQPSISILKWQQSADDSICGTKSDCCNPFNTAVSYSHPLSNRLWYCSSCIAISANGLESSRRGKGVSNRGLRTRRYTFTSRRWPMRKALSMACRSSAGLYDGSIMTTLHRSLPDLTGLDEADRARLSGHPFEGFPTVLSLVVRVRGNQV